MKILAATNNKHKLKELREILAPHGIEVLSAADAGGIPEIEEDQDSFLGNAQKKALEVAKAKNMTVFADDSGLCVDALNGEPGIYSARYAGENKTDSDRNLKLLNKLGNNKNRAAKFVCVIVLASPTKILGHAIGECHGTIAEKIRGENGFGYDPIFIPNGYDKSFAELGDKVKNELSHRSLALKNALKMGLFNLAK